jgi:hypothetical protein
MRESASPGFPFFDESVPNRLCFGEGRCNQHSGVFFYFQESP